MKYSFMTFSTPDLSLAEVLALASEYGYDGIEPRIDAKHAHGIEVSLSQTERAAARQQAADAGIALACLATSCKFNTPDAIDDMIAQAHDRIDLAGDLGIPALRVFGGGAGPQADGGPNVDFLVQAIATVADHAAERRVTICLETHDSWSDPKRVAAALRQVDHPAIAANWDILHPVRRGFATVEDSFQALKPWIRHLHVHDGDGPDGRMVPMGTGIVDHRQAVQLLLSIDYQGYLSGEWINWRAPADHLPQELATLKSYEAECRQ